MDHYRTISIFRILQTTECIIQDKTLQNPTNKFGNSNIRALPKQCMLVILKEINQYVVQYN